MIDPTDADALRRAIDRRNLFLERRRPHPEQLVAKDERRATCGYCGEAGDHHGLADCVRALEARHPTRAPR